MWRAGCGPGTLHGSSCGSRSGGFYPRLPERAQGGLPGRDGHVRDPVELDELMKNGRLLRGGGMRRRYVRPEQEQEHNRAELEADMSRTGIACPAGRPAGYPARPGRGSRERQVAVSLELAWELGPHRARLAPAERSSPSRARPGWRLAGRARRLFLMGGKAPVRDPDAQLAAVMAPAPIPLRPPRPRPPARPAPRPPRPGGSAAGFQAHAGHRRAIRNG